MEKIEGYVEHIVYQNQENGYTVLNLDTGEDEITLVGIMPGISVGMTIRAEGEKTEHHVYGEQIKVTDYSQIIPKDAVNIERYLSSGAIKGIGASRAKSIIKKFGEDTIRIIEEEPERLAEVKGISMRIAQEIAMQVEEKKDMREAMIFLQQYGISNNLAVKIYECYGQEMYNVLRENPYRLAEDISGVGFKRADEIATKAGISADSQFRIKCGIIYALSCAVSEGHVYLPEEELLNRASEILTISQDEIKPEFDNLVMDRKIVRKGDKLFLSYFYYAELNCAAMLSQLNIKMPEYKGDNASNKALADKLAMIAQNHKMEPDEFQIQAAQMAVVNGVFILSGGPGTGKTTTINLIIRYFEEAGLDIMLAAPTGRAAKRMTEATGYEAKTIHRLLELNPSMSDDDTRKLRFERNADNPLETDVLIIDEMSMVDIQLFYALLKAVMPGTRLILVGDVNQLPSVGPGRVLADLMESNSFPMVTLNRIFRQSQGSDIIVNAHKINQGLPIVADNKSKDFFLLERSEINLIYKNLVMLINDKLPGYVDATPFEIQVLTPMRKGPLGCETLNRVLQEYINPPAKDKTEHRVGDKLFRVGDKVMQIKNNYKLEWEIYGKYNIVIDRGLGIFNGDMGIVKGIDEQSSTMTVEFDENRIVSYPFSGLDELESAYAVTIHKAQGSEYPAVIMPLLGGPRMLLNRNLLYTGVTRAKKSVVILGSRRVVEDMINNENENRRYTDFTARITEMTN